MKDGYYRFPTISGEHIAFISEDDIWSVPVSGGHATRLTSNLGEVSRAIYSPDGKWLAFTGSEDGPSEVYCMPSEGGVARRLTYLSAGSGVVGWTSDSCRIVFASNTRHPCPRVFELFTVEHDSASIPEHINIGPASAISYGPGGGVVIGRNAGDPAKWKRYRGGTAGELWIDTKGNGEFVELIELKGNLAAPMWIGKRIFFLSDHEGIGNLYSCAPSGRGLRRHTDCDKFYVRNPSTDGRRIVFHAGADIYVYDPRADETARVDITFASPRTQRNRRFVDAAEHLDGFGIHPKGHSLALTSRGKLFSMALWEGAVAQIGEHNGVRYRLPAWLNDGKRIVCVSDETGDERLMVYHPGSSRSGHVIFEKPDIGRAYQLVVSPTADVVAFANHRCELVMVNLATRRMRIIETAENGRLNGLAWSPDGRWLACSFPNTKQTNCIKLYNITTGKSFEVTKPVLRDFAPAFDPDGKYLYFMGCRDFVPVHDNLHFSLHFPRATRLFLVTLRKDLPSPFVPPPHAPGERPEEEKKDPRKKGRKTKKSAVEPVRIDFDGIEHRVVAFPTHLGHYRQVAGLPGGRVLFVSRIEHHDPAENGQAGGKTVLSMYDFNTQEAKPLVAPISEFQLSRDSKTVLYRADKRLRALSVGDKPDEKLDHEKPGRKSGWIDLKRIRVSVLPVEEWRQMYREAWCLQRDHFWTEDMSRVDWERVYARYLPLLDRIGTRTEFSDLLWEMQGELGTSHAYERGGDYRSKPVYSQGYLGADLAYDRKHDGYRIEHIVRGDSWRPESDSPLNAPGVKIKEGDVITSIAGRRLGRHRPPGPALVNRAGLEVMVSFTNGARQERSACVRALTSETGARYREWVENNRERVHRKTKDRVGYVHIPDMGGPGFAEFFRLYLTEFDRDGLIVDVRYNSGGSISQLLLEKLARRRIAYAMNRWGPVSPYPAYSVAGPMVAVTNEYAGSDGDVFSHAFKLMGLGTLVGKRTWGGVVGIMPSSSFVDGGYTTQPEFAIWFNDVGWGVENYGTDPDIEVDMTPQDYAAGRDTQMDRAIEIILKQLKDNPPVRPDLSSRPDLSLPELPPRSRAKPI